MKHIVSLFLMLASFSLVSAQRYLPQTRFLQAEDSGASGTAPDTSQDEEDTAGTEDSGASEGSGSTDTPSDGSDGSSPPADEGGGDEYVGSESGSSIVSNINLPGDQNIRLAVAAEFPLNFYNKERSTHQLYVGGVGWIGYNYFLTEYLAVGFDVGFGFNITIGSKVFNYVPIMAAVTYQPVIWKIEFPLTAEVGFAWHSESGQSYFPALALKAQAGAMYRITESWSVGADVAYFVSPEFPRGKAGVKTKWGQFLTVGATARYHF